jgi:hypothetical protein
VNYGLDEGQWYCEALVEGYSLTVLTLNGPEEIELCSADEGKETLGVVTAPDGNSKGHFQKVKDKLNTWIARIKVYRQPASKLRLDQLCLPTVDGTLIWDRHPSCQ